MIDIQLTQPFGRFGNNLMQMSNGLYLAERMKGKFSNHIASNLVRKFSVDFSNDGPIERVVSGSMWNDYEKYNLTIADVEQDRPRLSNKYVLPNLLFYKKIDLSKYDVVTHIRGGDNHIKNGDYTWGIRKNIRRKDVSGGSVQSSVSFFTKIMRDNNYKSMLMVCEDRINPVVDVLDNLSEFDITYQSSSIENDANTILNAKNFIVSGMCSFNRLLIQMSENVETIFLPEYENSTGYPHFVFPKNSTIKKLRYHNYIPLNSWANTDDQCQLMVDHDEKDLEWVA